MKEQSSQVCRKIVEVIDFDEADAEKLELLKRYFGLKQNKEAIKALIVEKCDAIKLAEEMECKRQMEEAKAMEYLENGDYTSPLYM